MPLSGTLDIGPRLGRAPRLASLRTAPETLPRVEILHLMYEIDDRAMQELLPQALHPSIPPTATFVFWRCREGPLGAFTLAQVRIGSRAGLRPRGFLVGSYCDSATAADALRGRWGFNCRPGDVRLRRYYDRATGTVAADGRSILDVTLIDPVPISGVEVFYQDNMNLALASADGPERPWLVQVDPEYTFYRTERGRPLVERFVQEAWSTEGLRPVHPVSASYAVCDLTLPRIRYIVDPDRPVFEGTVTLRTPEKG